MPSTFSPALRLELIGNGEQAANWGNTTNTNLGTLLEQAITGVGNIVMTDANYTLISGNGVSDEARNAVLVVTGTLSTTRSVIVPSSNKFYAVRNATTGGQSILIRTAAGTGVTLANGFTQLMYCDGTNVALASVPVNPSTGSVVLNNPTINGFTGNTAVINVGSGQFYKDVSGNIGIGTSSPAARLHVAGSSGITTQILQSTGSVAARFNLQTTNDANGFLNYDTGNWVFFNNSAGSAVERMRIDAAGNVGIGTSSPGARLHVSTPDGVTNSRFAGSSFAVRIQSIAGIGATIEGTNNTESTYQPLIVGGSQVQFTASGVERMRVDAIGNVGIGTASPTQRLDVVGNINVSGSVTAPGGFVGNATSATTAATATNVSGVVAIANGGTGATTAATARTALGATAVGDAVFTAVDAASARTATGSAASGPVGSSSITMNTSRLLGRTTAGSGAIEEIAIGTGLSLSGGTLSSPPTSFNGLLLNVQVFTSSGTYTRTSGATRAVVIAVGGGGGGGSQSGVGGTGGTTSFGSHVTAVGGGGGGSASASPFAAGGNGGTGGTGATIAIPGQGGGFGFGASSGIGGGQGGGRSVSADVGNFAGVAGSRGGGGSGSKYDAGCAGDFGSGGGGQGETGIRYITSGLGATETVTIGGGGAGGTSGGLQPGGAGGSGYVIVYEYS